MAQNKFLLVTAFTTTMFFYAGVALAGGSCAPDGDATSTCHWEVEDGVLTISGSGDMKNYFSCGVNPLCQIKDSITSVVIGDNITSIGENAFNGFHITNIDIPSSVTSIGREAFRNTDITSLTIPTSVTSIGFGAFSDTDSFAMRSNNALSSSEICHTPSICPYTLFAISQSLNIVLPIYEIIEIQVKRLSRVASYIYVCFPPIPQAFRQRKTKAPTQKRTAPLTLLRG